MPTEPLHSIIYRELSIVKAREILKDTSPLLIELVNYGSNVLIRCASSSKSEVNIDLACLALYRHILEMTDAFEVLVTHSCIEPTKLLLRSSFETLISLEYILEYERYYPQRSLSWLFFYVRDQIHSYESLLPSTNTGKEFQESLGSDKWIDKGKFPLPKESDVSGAIENLKNLLQRPEFSMINEEYKNYQRIQKRRPQWYALFKGPGSIELLSNYVKRNAQYDFMYRSWSRITHAHDFHPFIKVDKDRKSEIREIRDSSGINEVSAYAVIFFLEATRLLLSKFRPTEDFGEYYKKEIQKRFQKLFIQ
jgi:hypothetical protein